MTVTASTARPRRRGGFGFAVVLIGIGVAALLANLGYLHFSLVAILALWPVLLIVAGIDLVLAHRAPRAALAIDVLVVGTGLLLLAARPFGDSLANVWPFVHIGGASCPAGASTASTVQVPRGDISSYTLHLTGGAGSYTMTGGASDLVSATSDQPDLYLKASGSDIRLIQCGGGSHDVRVQLADDVPVSLDLTGGAGEFRLDLRSVKLTELRATNGAATLDVDLPRPSRDVPIRLTGGASTMTVTLGDAEASVDVTGGFTSLNAPGDSHGFTTAGRQHWESRGYAAARDRYTITVTGGASTVNVR